MYWHRVINGINKVSKAEKNKLLHEEAYKLLEEKLITIFQLRKEDLKYKYDFRGKPYLEKSPFYFSISHSEDIVSCIIAKIKVGIDIERIRPINSFAVKKSLTDFEHSTLLNAKNKEEYFFRLWTLKESFLKVTGYGLSYGMKNIQFNLEENKNSRSIFIHSNVKGYTFKQEKINVNNKEYIVSIALEG